MVASRNQVFITGLGSCLAALLFLTPAPRANDSTEEPLSEQMSQLSQSQEPEDVQFRSPDSAKSQRGIELSAPVTIIDDSALKAGITSDTLAPEDQRNLETLWMGILQHNPTIQYALRQLNVPDDVRRHHKSLMARTMSGLLSGVGMLPYAFGNSAATIGAASVTQSVAQRISAKADKIDPKTLPTDAELVALSSTVESVRKDLVSSYFLYRQSLQNLADLDSQRAALANFRQKSRVTPEWQDDALSEMQLQALDRDRLLTRQQAETSYLRLERLVGPELMKEVSFVPGVSPEPSELAQPEDESLQPVEGLDRVELKESTP